MKRKKRIFRKKNIKRQDRKRRYRYLWRGALVFALIGLVGFGSHWGLSHLEIFNLKDILITGAPQSISKAQVLKRIKIPLGSNLYNIDLDKVRESLKGNAFFKKISVHRRWPHTLVIHIQEFRRAFVLYTSRFYYVDQEGILFKDITETQDSRDEVIFTGITEEELLSRPHQTRRALKKAFQLKAAYLKTPFAERFGISEIHFDKNNGYTLYPEQQKYSIKFGHQDFGEKIEKLTQVVEKLHQKNIKFSSIDLNYPGKVLMTL